MIVTEATPADVAELLALEHGRLIPRPLYRVLLVQLVNGPAWSLRRHGKSPPLAIAGIVHQPEISTVWLETGPGAGGALVALARRFRALAATEARLIGRPLIAVLRTDEGAALARLCGASVAGTIATWGT